MSSWRWVVLLLLLWSSGAWAAKNGVIQGKGVVLYSDPNKSSDVLMPLADGEPVVMSNYPTQGFYKIRTGSGRIGWVDSNSITVGTASAEEVIPPPPAAEIPAPSTAAAPAPQQPPSTLSSPSTTEVIPYEDVKPSTDYEVRRPAVPVNRARSPFEVKAFGGLQILKLTEVNQLAGGTVASSGFYFGGQFGIPLDRRMEILLRVEEITKSAQSGGTTDSLSSIPIMMGLAYSLLPEKPKEVRLQASLLVGLAASTSFTETSSNTTIQYASSAFTEMLKMDLDIPVSHSFEIFGETGYRFLKSASVGATINAGPSTSQPIIPLDFSGIFIGAGIGFFI